MCQNTELAVGRPDLFFILIQKNILDLSKPNSLQFEKGEKEVFVSDTKRGPYLIALAFKLFDLAHSDSEEIFNSEPVCMHQMLFYASFKHNFHCECFEVSGIAPQLDCLFFQLQRIACIHELKYLCPTHDHPKTQPLPLVL